jgi:MFS transporter, DHA1 family, inner membrane transport protein
VYIAGGGLTLFAAPIIGRLADWYGKLTIYRIIIPASSLLLLVITYLPRVAEEFRRRHGHRWQLGGGVSR